MNAPYQEPIIRQLLIGAANSNREADQFLRLKINDPALIELFMVIAEDEEENGGDAPKSAAFYLSQCSPELLRPFESRLLAVLPMAEENGYYESVLLCLAQFQSPEAREIIVEAIRSRNGVDDDGLREALKLYDGAGR